jgi:hypothetical protein
MRRTPRMVITVLAAVAAAAGVFLLAGCGAPGTIATPGGTLAVSVDSSYDTSSLQVVVVFDTNTSIGDGDELTYAFPLSTYADDFGSIYHTMSFSCPEVPEGDYFVYAWLDFDADGEYDPFDGEAGWLYDDVRYSNYYIDTSGVPYTILYAGSYSIDPVPNYFVTDRFAAPLEIFLSATGAS